MRVFCTSLFAAAAFLTLPACRPALARTDLKQRQEIFEIVWTRVKEKHFDPKLNGVDWNAVRVRYTSLVASAKTETEFYALMERMLGELKQSHFNVIPPDRFLAEDEKREGGGSTGMTVQLIEERPTISRVEPGSPAEKAGLKPGFVLMEVDGKPLDSILPKLRERHLPLQEERVQFMIAVMGRMGGGIGEKVRLSYLDGDNRPQSVEVTRTSPRGELIQFANLPPTPGFVEARRITPRIGYIRFNIFLIQPLLGQIRAAFTGMKSSTDGVIFDLRENPGGVGAMAYSLAGMVAKKPGQLGVMKMRSGEFKFPYEPDEKPYSGKVVILTDEFSLSTSEIMAGGMQENGDAVVVGRRTGGMVLPSIIEKLPDGGRLQYAFADFKTAKGVLLEGRGVIPNLSVELTRESLLKDGDPILKAAVQQIQRSHSLQSHPTQGKQK